MAKEKLTPEEKEELKKQKAEQKILDTIKKDIEVATKNVNTLLSKYTKPLIIRTEEQLEEYIENAIKDKEIAIDTETTGLNVYTDKIVGVCLYSKSQIEAYIPINHVDYITKKRVDFQLTEDIVSKHLNKLKDTNIVMHNADFDIRVLRRIGSYLTCYWDTLIAAHLLNENEEHGLKPLHQKYVLKNSEDEFSFGKLFSTKIMTFADIPIEIASIYAAHDAKITSELKDFQYDVFNRPNRPDLKELYENVFMGIEMKVLEAVCDMEDTGFSFDDNYRKELEQKYGILLQEKDNLLLEKLKEFSPLIDKWRKTKEANNKTAKFDNILGFFDLTDIYSQVRNIEDIITFDVEKSGDTFMFTNEKHNITFKANLDELKEGKAFNKYDFSKQRYKEAKITKADMTNVSKIIKNGKYEVQYNKSLSEQLPDDIEEINLSSPTQMAILLYDILKRDNKLKGDEARSTGVEALKNINDDFTKELLKYREFSKLIDAFIFSLPKFLTDDGKIHCNLNQVGTVTGRFSSSKPNLQQIPSNNKEIRKLFIAPTITREVESQNIFVFKNTEEIEVSPDEWVFVKDLKVGDKIQNTEIKNIKIIGKEIEIEVM